jgi:hypothetical protein
MRRLTTMLGEVPWSDRVRRLAGWLNPVVASPAAPSPARSGRCWPCRPRPACRQALVWSYAHRYEVIASPLTAVRTRGEPFT